MKRRKPRPRKSRIRAAAPSPETNALVQAATDLVVSDILLKEAVEGARRKRRRRITLHRLIMEDPDVHLAFRCQVDHLIAFMLAAAPSPAVGAEERERPVAEAAPDPRRVPIRSHEAEEPEEDEDE